MLKNYKLILVTAIITTAIIVLAFVTGTFYPNKWTKQKIENLFHKAEVKEITYLGFDQPEFVFNDKKTFIEATGKCVDFLNFTTDRLSRVPTSIIIAMAGVESAWGTSRFALEGNAIFGQWTWDGQGIAPLNRDGDKSHKILKFPILRASVKAYQNNLNTHKTVSYTHLTLPTNREV